MSYVFSVFWRHYSLYALLNGGSKFCTLFYHLNFIVCLSYRWWFVGCLICLEISLSFFFSVFFGIVYSSFLFWSVHFFILIYCSVNFSSNSLILFSTRNPRLKNMFENELIFIVYYYSLQFQSLPNTSDLITYTITKHYFNYYPKNKNCSIFSYRPSPNGKDLRSSSFPSRNG